MCLPLLSPCTHTLTLYPSPLLIFCGVSPVSWHRLPSRLCQRTLTLCADLCMVHTRAEKPAGPSPSLHRSPGRHPLQVPSSRAPAPSPRTSVWASIAAPVSRLFCTFSSKKGVLLSGGPGRRAWNQRVGSGPSGASAPLDGIPSRLGKPPNLWVTVPYEMENALLNYKVGTSS